MIGIIGQGFVGNAVRLGMQHVFDIKAYDKDVNKFRNVNGIEDVVLNTDIAFVCVPTPMMKTGECDLKILNTALTEIQNEVIAYNKKNYIVVVKSTIPPGTTDRLNKLYISTKVSTICTAMTASTAVPPACSTW